MAPAGRALKYVDLTLDIREGAAGEFNVTAFAANSPPVHGTLTLPFQLHELAGVINGVSETIRGAQPALREGVSEGPARETAPPPRDLGVRLYASLFSKQIHSLFEKMLESTAGQRESGIRIRLSFDIKGHGIAEVASLPWELLTRDASEGPLALSRQTVLVRSLPSAGASHAIPFERPLRILVVLSNPKGTADLNLSEEKERITKEWGRLLGVEVTILGGGDPADEAQRPTYDNLCTRLANDDYHVFHYMGHGDFDAETGLGVLLLENTDGTPCPVTGEQLWRALKDEKTLRLVFLNACKTAATGAQSATSPFAGIADSLIRGGIPAVVAMQFPISDRAAILFAQTFYQRIVDGHPVDAAVAEGRKVLQGPAQSAWVQREWVTPVLFMRSGDGVLFTQVETTGTFRVARKSGQVPVVTASLAAPTAARAPKLAAGPAAHEFGVFLASANSARIRQSVADGLQKTAGVEVITDTPETAAEHAAAVRALAQSTDLFVHILDDHPGEPIIDNPSLTYALEELKIGMEAARSQLVLMPEGLVIDASKYPEYAAFVESLATVPYGADRFEFARLGRPQMLDYVLEKRLRVAEAAKRAAARHSGPISAAYVDMHVSDVRHANDLVEYLGRQVNLSLNVNSSGGEQTAGEEQTAGKQVSEFEKQIMNVPLFIVVFGNVGPEWVANRMNAALKVVAKSGVSTQICVYVAPPIKASDQLRFVRNYRHAMGMERFDATGVDALIKAASELDD